MSHDTYSQEITRAAWFVETGQYERAMQILARLLAGYPDNASTTYKVMAEAHKKCGAIRGRRGRGPQSPGGATE